MAYNEQGTTAEFIREMHAELSALSIDYEVLIVDDGSTDGTSEIADDIAAELHNLRVIHHVENSGLGQVYRTGFEQAEGDFLTFFPADGQFPASIVGQFLPHMDEVDMVLGYLPMRNSSLLAKTLSRVERILYNMLFGPMPRFQGITMFRRQLLSEIELKSLGRGWTVLMEFILRVARSDKQIRSLPTEMRPRTSGSSKVNNLRTIWANLREMARLQRLL